MDVLSLHCGNGCRAPAALGTLAVVLILAIELSTFIDYARLPRRRQALPNNLIAKSCDLVYDWVGGYVAQPMS